jgi:peptide/nickel transport system permease protein
MNPDRNNIAANKATPKKQRSLAGETWRRFKKNKLAMSGMFFLFFLIVVSVSTIIVDMMTNNGFYDAHVITQDLVNRLQPPNAAHPFGLDEFGRDILLRVLWGTRYSLFMGLAAISVSTVFGVILGSFAGFYGRVPDNVIMRVMDVLLAIPSTLLAMCIVAAMGASITNVLIAVGISYIPTFARVSRATVMTIKDLEFIEAARAAGAGKISIIFHSIIPNSLAPIIVQATLGTAGAILTIALLSFIGLGVQPPLPEWGAMLTNARTYIRDAWHITAFPGLSIMLTILSLNVMGDGLRDALDPKLKT